MAGRATSGFGSGLADLPYELNLARNAARGLPSTATGPDNPFGLAELERLLRPYDRDATTLPARLAALTSPTLTPSTSVLLAPNLRKAVTTESWDVPVPGVPATSATTPTATNTRVADLLKARLMSDGILDRYAGDSHAAEIVAGRPVGRVEDEHQPPLWQRARLRPSGR